MFTKYLYLIGLTGNIACGKSSVVAMLRELGAHAIDADVVTHALQLPGEPVYQQIVATFGEQILSAPDGPIDRKALGAIVFSDPAELRRLEQIVHPAVHGHVEAWLRDVARQAESDALGVRHVAVIDAIKLIEAGWPAICDAIWVVSCPIEQQVARLVATRGLTEEDARTRIAAQPPQGEKIARATLVIDNGGTLEATRQQVEAAWAAIPRSAD